MSTKQKRAVFFIGVTAAVYGLLRYLLPLVLPFLFAYGLARLVWPLASFLNRRFGIPESAGAALGLLLYAAAGAALLLGLGMLAGRQISELLRQLPGYMEQAERLLTELAGRVGRWFGETGSMENQASVSGDRLAAGVAAGLRDCMDTMQEEILTKAAGGLMPAAATAGNLFAAATVAAVSSIFFIKERRQIKGWMDGSVFRREIRMVTRRLGSLARAFFRTQGIIFLLVTSICVAGLLVLGNRYFLLVGIVIGIVDVLPVFGTGTILIPWAILSVLTGNWAQAGGLMVIYLLTYYLREFLEAHMMGQQLGIGSLEMMAAMYVGLKLFGLFGLFLGPIGWILIKEIDKTLYSEYNKT